MKAIQILQTGGPEVLEVRNIPTPKPGAGEALVKTHACGVNFIDTYYREGRYPAELPYVLGEEAAGTVAAVGDGVTTLKEGDRVAWCSIPGTYAEFAVAPADRLVPIPDGVSFEQAAAAMLQGMTAHYLSHSAYPIQNGDEVLIHAGAGGTGLLLTQMAKARGARVFTTVSTEEKAELSRGAGADEVIFYTKMDFAAEVKRLTEGRGLAVVYDSVGKSTFEQSLTCLRRRGTMVLFGGSSGAVPPFDLVRLSTMGSLHVTRPRVKDYIAERWELLERSTEVLQGVSAGTLKLRVEHIYPLAEVAQAHRDLESRKTTGKLILIP
ncbi:quinone oxidoreductase [Granulicella sp. dw_53]|uniref:quinone oxidoreductase family protein n=1 Tax=Granulicella sp. dw_53 TaxID=2719792 RepID=UPI001BD356FB|nr:quinone oxidoreductase [Granulicella sp. dw_53]